MLTLKSLGISYFSLFENKCKYIFLFVNLKKNYISLRILLRYNFQMKTEAAISYYLFRFWTKLRHLNHDLKWQKYLNRPFSFSAEHKSEDLVDNKNEFVSFFLGRKTVAEVCNKKVVNSKFLVIQLLVSK